MIEKIGNKYSNQELLELLEYNLGISRHKYNVEQLNKNKNE